MTSASAPVDLPSAALASLALRPLALYVHVPFCAVRCGYCDFNTYAPGETTASPDSYVTAALAEIDLAAEVLGNNAPPLDTVFFGGGTPTLLPSSDLVRLLDRARGAWGLAPSAEVTTEANPDSVTRESLAALVDGGFTRISFGMQSAVPHVLRVLERTHDPERVAQAVMWAREAGFDQVSLDLIYGTPGETDQDWQRSLQAAVATEPDHISAYSLIVEDGTALARRVRRHEIAAPDDDQMAAKYLAADAVLEAAGLEWYEVSNWARPGGRCRHNLHYWRSDNWWGIGPGAHSHIGGVRWWNLKRPTAYADRLAAGLSPAQDREELDPSTRWLERVLLEIRLADGLPMEVLAERAPQVESLIGDGLVRTRDGHLVLTREGRLLADAVVRRLVD